MTRLLLLCSIVVVIKATTAHAQSSWASLSSKPGGTVTSLGINGNGDLYAVTDAGVYRSSDHGNSWNKTQNALTLGPVYGFSHGYIFVGGGKGIFRSNNDGATWKQLRITPLNPTDPQIMGFAIAPSGMLLVATGSTGLYLSTNDGDSWYEQAVFQDGYSFPIYVAASPKGELFAMTAGKTARSNGIGQVWQEISGSFGTSPVFAFGPMDEIVAAGYNGIFRSTDTGTSWAQIAPSDVSNYPNYSLSITGDGNIYEGVYSDFSSVKGLNISTDNGSSWQPASIGLTSMRVHAFAIEHGYVYVATDSGVFKNTVASSVDKEEAPSSLILEQIFPNPVGNSATIRFSNAVQGRVTLRVFDACGHEVSTIFNGATPPGTHDIVYRTNTLSAGVYYYVLQSGGITVSRAFAKTP